jgi:hypothetical protein
MSCCCDTTTAAVELPPIPTVLYLCFALQYVLDRVQDMDIVKSEVEDAIAVRHQRHLALPVIDACDSHSGDE